MIERKTSRRDRVSRLLRPAVAIVLLQLCLPTRLCAQGLPPSPANDPQPTGLTLSATGHCDYSADGVTFAKLAQGQVLDPRQDGKMLPVNSSFWVKDLIQLDQVQAAGEDLVPDKRAPKP